MEEKNNSLEIPNIKKKQVINPKKPLKTEPVEKKSSKPLKENKISKTQKTNQKALTRPEENDKRPMNISPNNEETLQKPLEKKSKTIENNDLIKSVIFLKEKGLLKDSTSNVKFETVKEAEDSKIEDILSVIKTSLNKLKEDISEIQKEGIPLKLYTLKLLQLQMKVKIWKATYSKEELEKIYNVIDLIEEKIRPIKLEVDEKKANEE